MIVDRDFFSIICVMCNSTTVDVLLIHVEKQNKKFM